MIRLLDVRCFTKKKEGERGGKGERKLLSTKLPLEILFSSIW